MKPLRDISIRHKQMLIILLTSGVALLIACAAFVIYDLAIFRREMVEKMSSLAEVVGNNSTGALDFNDPKSARESLASLRGEPTVTSACIYDQAGRPFATYTRADSLVLAAPPVQTSRHEFAHEHLLLFRTIKQGNEKIGTIYIASSLNEFKERVAGYVGIVAAVLAGSLLVALILSSRLQRVISLPILQLAAAARTVAQEKNYALRAKKHSGDELGELVDGFNEMLAEIQERDFALQAARDTLTHSVRARTGELASSVSLLNATLEASMDGILAVDRAGRITSCNRRFVELWGFTSEVMDQRQLDELLPLAAAQLKNADAFRTQFRAMRESPELEAFDVLEFLDGRVVERVTKPQHIGDRCVGTVITYRDITERKRADEALRQAEELFRRAIAGADAVPYSYDYRTRTYAFMGAGIKQLIGYTSEEMNPGQWQNIIKESIMLGETAGLTKAEAARRAIGGELRQWRCDMLVTTRDGKSRWISDSSAQELDAAGKPTGSMGILQDITERKQAEITTSVFSKLGRRLSAAASREEASRLIGEVSDDLFGWDAISIQEYSGPDDMVSVLYEMDTFEGQRVESAVAPPSKATAVHHRIFESGAELILRDATAFLPEATSFGNHSRPSASIMYAPIRSAVDIVGILSVHSYSPNAYTEQDLATLQTLADHCGGALKRIAADEALRESEFQFRLVWDTSVDGMRLSRRDGVVLMVNDAYCRMVEKTKAEVELQPLTVIHGAGNAAQVLGDYQEKFDAAGGQSSLETEVTLWNGRKVWFELSNSILNLPGQPRLLLSIFRDITGRKQAEAELASERHLLRTLLDSSTEFIYFKDRESRFLRASSATVKQFNLPTPEELIGKSDFDFFSEDHARPAYDDEQRIIQTGQPMVGKTEKEVWPDGHVTWVLTSKFPLRNVAGEIIGTFGLSKDVTAIKVAEVKLELVHKQLLETSRQAGMAEVATSVLHNVGNVLNSVNISASILADRLRTSRVSGVSRVTELLETNRHDLAGFLTANGRADQVINFLKSLSQHLTAENASALDELQGLTRNIEHIKEIVAMQQSYARISGVTETVKPTDLVEDALRMNAGALTRHQVRLVREYAPDVPEIMLEKHKALQILVNLIRNAKHACDDSEAPDKSLTLRVTHDDHHVRIAVVDNGVGIPPENLTRIFSHGFTTRKNGHGFGLHSGALAARELGGSLTVHSEGPGQGAVFTLELPCAPPETGTAIFSATNARTKTQENHASA